MAARSSAAPRSLLFFLSLQWLIFFVTSPPHARAALGDVLQTFHSPGNWPEGLAWDGEYLWNSDGYGGTIYKINPEDGAVIKSYHCPGSFPEGLTFARGYLYNCDWDTGLIYQLRVGEEELEIVSTFPGPGEHAIGLTFDGLSLWHAAWNQHLYKIRLADGAVLQSFSTPSQHPEDLAWDGGYLWLTDWYSQRIYKIDPATGAEVLSFHSPGTLSVGLTFDGRYLWNSDTSGWIYRLDVGPQEIPALNRWGFLLLCILFGVMALWAAYRHSRRRAPTQAPRIM